MWFFRKRTAHPRLSYIICSDKRTGSTLLCEALRETGIAGMPAEYFNTFPLTAQYRREYLGINRDKQYVEKVIQGSTSVNGVFGTKVHADQLSVLLEKIKAEGKIVTVSDGETLARRFPNLRYILLTRENKIRQAISLYRARESKVWWEFEKMPPMYKQIEVPAQDPPFDAAAIKKYLAYIERGNELWAAFFKRNDITPLTLTYEELTNDLTGSVRRMLEYLKIPSNIPELKPQTLRQADSLTDEWEKRFREMHPQKDSQNDQGA
jgi:LPS sulfotransferase NodH